MPVTCLANNPAYRGPRKYPVLPHDLASDIQQFAESQFARQYFSTHRTGFIFKRTVPVTEIMTWQKVRLRHYRRGPLLTARRAR